MSNEGLLLVALSLTLASGVPCLLPGSSAIRPGIAVALLSGGCAVGLVAAGLALFGVPGEPIRWTWRLLGVESVIAIDALSAWFLVPIFLISALGAWYGLEYWPLDGTPGHGARVPVFYGTMTAAMALVATARDGIVLIAAWEAMGVSAFFLVTSEDNREEVREAGWIFLVAAHASTLLLFAFAVLLAGTTGSFLLQPLATGHVAPGAAAALFLLALGGFGIKAGLFPLHVWLPPAHSIAPSHVSALMSGVMIKLGVYGVLRVLWMLAPAPLWWGGLLLALGGVTGVLGIVLAVGQGDLKRLLAYCSIENLGILFLGIGLAAAGAAIGDARWTVLGLAAVLLHTWNHSLFKTLLFFGAGAVLHRTHTRAMDELGGLAKSMPRTAALFLVGAVGIAGLPPLNGFVSEWFVYLAFFGGLTAPQPERWLAAAAGISTLALIGSLSLVAFVKAYAAVFLGEPRSEAARHGSDGGAMMLAPMAALALCCGFIGLAPAWVGPAIRPVVSLWSPKAAGVSLGEIAPLGWLTALGGSLLILLAAAVWSLRRGKVAATVGTWDCGYGRSTPRVQYTASSFGQLIETLWRRVLLLATDDRRETGAFPSSGSYRRQILDPVLAGALFPLFRNLAQRCVRLRVVQQGQVHMYLVYIASIFLLGIAFAALSPWSLG
jgi:hydrogenase-4 component B